MIWTALLLAALGCYLLKLAGMSVPAHVLERPVVRRVATLLPVAMLAALIAVQVFATGDPPRLVLDTRVAGLAAAVIALLLRAPFIVVVVAAAATAALLRLA